MGSYIIKSLIIFLAIFFLGGKLFSQNLNTKLYGTIDLPGKAFDVTVQGQYAYVVGWDFGAVLSIVNIKSPNNLDVTGSLPLQDGYGIALVDEYAFVADGVAGLKIIDVGDPTGPNVVGNYNTPGTARKVKVVGNFAYIADETMGLRILDVSDYSNPFEISSINTPGSSFDVQIVGDYAFVADYASGLRIIDISDPYNPFEYTSFITSGTVNDIEIVGNYLYMTDGIYLGPHKFRILDITDITNIQEVGSLSSTDWYTGLFVKDQYAYIASWFSQGLTIIDISDPSLPQKVGWYKTPGSTRNLFVIEDLVYITDWDLGLKVIQHNFYPQKLNSHLLSSIDIPGKVFDIALKDSFAYAVSWDAGSSLNVIYFPDRRNPILLGSFPTHDSYGITINKSFGYIADGYAGLKIINLSNPSSPVLIGEYETPGTARDVKILDNYAFIADQTEGLQILDITDKSNPTFVSSYNTSGESFDVEISGNYAYIADAYNGLVVLDISSPATPIEIANYSTSTEVVDIELVDNTLYMTEGFGGFSVWDATDPVNLIELGRIVLPHWLLGFEILDNYAFIASWLNGGLSVIDISDPSNMSLVAYFKTLDGSRNVAVKGRTVILTDWNLGIKIIKTTLPTDAELTFTEEFVVTENFNLHQNFPNPFNPSTKITFDLPVNSQVRLSVFNSLGEEVGVLADNEISAGTHSFEFDAKNLSSGFYFYRIDVEGEDGNHWTESKKMILMK